MSEPTELAQVAPAQIEKRDYSREQIDLIKNTVARGTTDNELNLFLYVAKRHGLDPLLKQIHAIKRWSGKEKREIMSIQTGIDGFRLIACRTGNFNGMEGPFWCGDDGRWIDVWLKTAPPLAAKVLVFRHGCEKPFTAVAKWTSYVQTNKEGKLNHMWGKMGDLMLGKCAEALALRRGFPAELSSIYSFEEMGQMDQGASVKQPQRSSESAGSPQKAKEPNGKKSDNLPEGDERISDAQRKRMFAILKRAGKSIDELRQYLGDQYGIASTNDIGRAQYQAVTDWCSQEKQ